MQSLTTFAAIRTFSCWTDSQAIMWRKTSFDIHIEGRQFHIGNFYLKTPNFLLTYSLTAALTLILNQLFQLVIQLITNTEPDHGGCCLELVEFKRHKNRSTADPRTLHWSWIDDGLFRFIHHIFARRDDCITNSNNLGLDSSRAGGGAAISNISTRW